MATPMSPTQWLAALHKWGVQLKEFPGWQTRGRPQTWGPVHGILIHHTGSDIQTDDYNRWLFTEGRPSEGIPGPLAQATVDFDGDFHLGAAGRANQAGKGSLSTLNAIIGENHPGYDREITPGPDSMDGNARTYGFEVRYDGGQAMTGPQYATAVRAAAAVCDYHGWSALAVIGHREWSGRKWDPGLCPMTQFRRDVRDRLAVGPGGAQPGGFLMALSDGQQKQMYDWMYETRNRVMGAIPAQAARAGGGGRLLDTLDGSYLVERIADRVTLVQVSEAITAALSVAGFKVDEKAIADAVAARLAQAVRVAGQVTVDPADLAGGAAVEGEAK